MDAGWIVMCGRDAVKLVAGRSKAGKSGLAIASSQSEQTTAGGEGLQGWANIT